MFKDSLTGLDKILKTDIPRGGIIIVTGTPGSLKSAFVYNLLSHYLKSNKNEKGIYITLEESKKSHMKNMKSLGVTIEKRLRVSDLASFRAHIGFEDMDYLDLIMKRTMGPLNTAMGEHFSGPDMATKVTKATNPSMTKKKAVKLPITCFALDSLNALYSLIDLDKHRIRNKLLEFFTFLRQNNLTSFIVLELASDTQYSDEFFLADGIIEFGVTSASQDTLKRYVQIKKMRATKHSLDPFLIEVGKNGLQVVGKLL